MTAPRNTGVVTLGVVTCPKVRAVAEQTVRYMELQAERRALLADLQARPIRELSGGIHDEKICRLGAVRIALHALGALDHSAHQPLTATAAPEARYK